MTIECKFRREYSLKKNIEFSLLGTNYNGLFVKVSDKKKGNFQEKTLLEIMLQFDNSTICQLNASAVGKYHFKENHRILVARQILFTNSR